MEAIKEYWEDIMERLMEQQDEPWLERKVKKLHERGQVVKRATFHLKPYHQVQYGGTRDVSYMLALSLLIKDRKKYYLEEGVYHCEALLERKELVEQHTETEKSLGGNEHLATAFTDKESSQRVPFEYDRRAAVQYAERWWDSYNPAYKHFEVDCTNYISQCLRAGGAPMWGQPNRGKGWWYSSNSWSYSWAVAHSLRWYLSGARQGLTAKEVTDASLLSPGDVICYDFQGTGRFDHNTIVVKMNSQGLPLVNAHTTNSRHRFWDYQDSTAYTPSIEYKFFKIGAE
ncbi:amidase domain-containing protein [Halobacillus amylolyticus]|uniref:Amidase domain-containing protein n=1 Tax=Halobacillus amylolyticus TaxID=2932259 RepID=A0ABY4HF82_9BACI|nr:amidase domain-containing protein [Halobacillus amylolyticus]UOR13307.1 amidase domain-containing protein [Halobacillus amylolyticus]